MTSRRAMAGAAAILVGLVLAPAAWAGGRHGPEGDRALQFRLGGFFPRGTGAFWADTEASFTLDHADFNDSAAGISLVGAFGDHFEAAFNADLYESTVGSAVSGYVDEFELPIFHDTRLASAPLTVDLRFLPFCRKRGRGSRPVLYFGAGLGVAYWEYDEIGDFVDFTDDTIIFDRFSDTGLAFETHVLAGIELPMGEYWSVLFEGRRTWVDDEPGNDFAGLGRLDLGGRWVFVGASRRF